MAFTMTWTPSASRNVTISRQGATHFEVDEHKDLVVYPFRVAGLGKVDFDTKRLSEEPLSCLDRGRISCLNGFLGCYRAAAL